MMREIEGLSCWSYFGGYSTGIGGLMFDCSSGLSVMFSTVRTCFFDVITISVWQQLSQK